MLVLKLWELGTLSVTHQTEVLKDGRHIAKNGANSESSWSCLRESLIQANRRGDDTTAVLDSCSLKHRGPKLDIDTSHFKADL
jgi:hypothetical protein